MPILGINEEKCTNCKQCTMDCVAICFRWNRQDEKVIFNNDHEGCILCGHCIACCPVNAIHYNDMQDVPISIKNAAIPDFDTLYSLFRSKRSIRHYKPKPVADEILMKIINAMRYAPTGGNNREMKIQIISDPAKIEKISNGVVDTLLKSPETSDGYRALLKYKQKKGLDPIFFKSPHVILITGDGENDLVNSAIAITYGMLAAECLGLGTCWIGLAYTSFIANEDLRKQTAGISNKIWGVFTIGEPNIKFHQSPPRPSLL